MKKFWRGSTRRRAAKSFAPPIAKLGLKHAGPFPPVFSDSGGIFELFWNGKRLPLSRWPNSADPKDWTTMKKAVVNGDAKTGGTFEYRDERPARWLENHSVWLKGQWRVPWEDPAIRVAKIDPANHTITFAAGIPLGIGNKYTRPSATAKSRGARVNLIEEIDQPGEWAIDFDTQTLFLWPPGSGRRADGFAARHAAGFGERRGAFEIHRPHAGGVARRRLRFGKCGIRFDRRLHVPQSGEDAACGCTVIAAACRAAIFTISARAACASAAATN